MKFQRFACYNLFFFFFVGTSLGRDNPQMQFLGCKSYSILFGIFLKTLVKTDQIIDGSFVDPREAVQSGCL